MLLKHRPEDFVVEERTRFEPRSRGPISVYELRKRGVDTFEAIRRIAARTRVPLGRFAYAGLKDRQGVTTQLISVEGRVDTKLQIGGLRLRYLGRSDGPIAASDLLGNTFTVVVRDLGPRELSAFAERLPRLEAHGLVNYFDDQRFGTVVSKQGLPGRAMVLGEHEEAVRLILATPGLKDPPQERRFKHLVQARWGEWEELARRWGGRRGAGMVRHLARRPGDFKGALRNFPGNERAIHVFAYQSLIWNRAVARYLEAQTTPSRRSTSRYAAGEHVWLEYAADEPLPPLVETFPLLDHTVEPQDPAVRAAVDAVLAEEGLTLPEFRIKGVRGCFFRHYERPLLVRPTDLTVLGGPEPDDVREGKQKVSLRFSLPPGSYATLALKRLFAPLPGRERSARRPRQRRPARGRKRSG